MITPRPPTLAFRSLGLLAALAGTHLAGLAAAAAPASAARPNIVLLYADDMGVGDVAILNPDSKIRTPHLDRLARDGLRFTDAHSSSGVCTPSRYALLAAGIAIAGIDIGESYGSPAGRTLFTAFQTELTRTRGYSAKPLLLGRSRGGLMLLTWAAEHPEKIGAFAGIYPVVNRV